MNDNINQKEKTIYDIFLRELKRLLEATGEVTSAELGDILSKLDYKSLGKYFKVLGYGGVVGSIKESLDKETGVPIYQYVLGTALSFLAFYHIKFPFLVAVAGTAGLSFLAEKLWDASVDFGELLAENPGREKEVIENYLVSENIIISKDSSYIFTLFCPRCDLLYINTDLIEILKDKAKTASETRSPLVVDLDGDGVETVSVEEGVYFDHDGNGFAEKTGWVSGDDGILVRDLNGDGEINDGSELFGDQTVLSNGEKASNGFEALADLDSNHDGVFDGDDEAFGEVMVWQDKNGNGIVDDGELMTLNEAGITSITLDYENQSITDINGNGHNQTGTFVKTDGTNGTITDVWFEADYSDTIDLTDIEIPEEISALPNVEGFGNVHDLHTAMALDDSGELKSLVEQYISATDLNARESILLDLIYTWAGVIDIDPFSRSISSSVNPIGDARKLETLERFLGEKYVGIWCTGTRDPNPHRHAAPILLDAFEQLKNYIDGVLLSQTHYKDYVDSIIIEWDEESLQWNVNVSEVLGMLESAFDERGEGGASFVSTFGKK